jgi:tetratricopeptide (TPR) repeat protein
VPLHLERGWLALQQRDVAGARTAFNEALKRAPDSFDARNGLITVAVAERKFDAAKAQINEWLGGSPDDGRLRTLAARVELAAGNSQEAERILRDLVSSDPSQYDAYEILGALYARQGRIDQAIAQYEALAERRPAGARGAQTLIAMLRDAKGDRDQARSTYEQVLKSDPRAGVAANNLAWIYAEDGRLDEALRLATVAKEELRLRPEAEDTLGWVYLQKGLAWHAIAAFERARDRAPSNPLYHYHLGLAYAKQGDQDRARAALQRALKLKPDFSGAEDARAQLAALDQPAGTGG